MNNATWMRLSEVGRKRCWYKFPGLPPPFEHANNLTSTYQLLPVTNTCGKCCKEPSLSSWCLNCTPLSRAYLFPTAHHCHHTRWQQRLSANRRRYPRRFQHLTAMVLSPFPHQRPSSQRIPPSLSYQLATPWLRRPPIRPPSPRVNPDGVPATLAP